jgi:predicted MPP superfamily phosphohydrolase
MVDEVLFTWVHVSDLHAGHGDSAVQVDQRFVMADLLRDAASQVDELVRIATIPRVDAIVVTGDVAFSGAEHEYELAAAFLDKLRAATKLPDREAVYVVPGNHDVDRRIVLQDPAFAGAFEATRRGEQDLRTLIEARSSALVQRKHHFRQFATKHAPRSSPADHGGWSHRFAAGDLDILLVGIDSARMSQDDADHGRLWVGRDQIEAIIDDPADDPLRIVLAHHPLEWLADPEFDRHRIRTWSDIYLHGHVHQQHGELIMRGGGDRALTIVAGAAHADPHDPQVHHYQIASIVRSGPGLELRIWPRVARDGRGFAAQGEYAQGVTGYAKFDLRSRRRPSASPPASPAPIVVPTPEPFMPALATYLAWHPDSVEGQRVATSLFEILRGGGVDPGIGIPTFFRSVPAVGSTTPLPVSPTEARATAVVMLLDRHVVGDDDWRDWIMNTSDAFQDWPRARIYPVWLDADAMRVDECSAVQAIRANEARPSERAPFIVHRILHLLWRHLEAAADSSGSPPPVRVFLSHAKRDGEPIAASIKEFLEHNDRQISTWFDRRDIGDGFSFASEIDRATVDDRTVLLAIQTDAYWTRPFCIGEFLSATQRRRPIVVVDASTPTGERHGAWLGRAPVVRWPGSGTDEFFERLLFVLLVEALRFAFLPEHLRAISTRLAISGRLEMRSVPPTTYDLAYESDCTIVYPDPPLVREEREVLDAIAKPRNVHLRTPSTLLVPR